VRERERKRKEGRKGGREEARVGRGGERRRGIMTERNREGQRKSERMCV